MSYIVSKSTSYIIIILQMNYMLHKSDKNHQESTSGFF
jgi:hypothetical protein